MKKSNLKKEPLHLQNMHLYFFGVIFNIIGYVLEDSQEKPFFEGHSFSSFLVVMSYALTGLTVSLIMK